MKRIVIKLGTSTLTKGSRKLSRSVMLEITRQVALLQEDGYQVVMITSGAQTAGREVLQSFIIDKSLPSKQMLCSIGQVRLMEIWTNLFSLHEITVGQLLLTRSDFSNRAPYLNVRDTLNALLDHKTIPIVNENDPVATKESYVGDNDNLAALISNMIAADLLIILTDTEGLYTKDPREHKDAEHIPFVDKIDEKILTLGKDSTTGLGTGGMSTKIQAAELASHTGTPTVITSFSEKDILLRLVKGEKHGTRFNPSTTTKESRKRWLLSEKSQGKIMIDIGAEKKLKEGGASLLPVGIEKVEGTFERGEIVHIITMNGKFIGAGLTNYTSGDVKKISKLQSHQIEEKLGFSFGPEVIHRDNMTIIKEKTI